MDWKLILLLSLFALAMGLGTVFFISSAIEPVFWLLIFIFCAYMIAKRTTRPFLHGLVLGLVNCVWVILAHVALADTYLANHAREAEMMRNMGNLRLLMVLFGIPIGVITGCIIGLFSVAASRLMRNRQVSATAR